MKLFAIIFSLCLLFCSHALADQQTTVLTRHEKIGALPYIDGSTNEELEKEANNIIRQAAQQLAKKNNGTISYEVTLNRPSLVSVLLRASADGRTSYCGLNLDLTTGREFSVTDFFVDNDEIKRALGAYGNTLFGETGIFVRARVGEAYEKFIPYTDIMHSLRIGEAGRILQIARLTENAADKTLTLERAGLAALKLPCNPSTGYGWQLTAASKHVRKVGSSFTMPAAGDQRTGSPGVEFIFLAFDAPGTYDIKMEYRRSWERLSLKSFRFKVVVK